MINKYQIKQLIKDTLLELDMFSEDAVNLLLGTMAQESDFGTYIKELKGGDGLSFFRMTPEIHDDLVKNFISKKESLAKKIKTACGVSRLDSSFLLYNIKYSICMMRIFYKRVDEPIPTNIEGYSKFWKAHYNKRDGKGTQSQFIYNYKTRIL
jgi:hypothetical protein